MPDKHILSNTYLTLMSILFGLLISIWVLSTKDIVDARIATGPEQADIREIRTRLRLAAEQLGNRLPEEQSEREAPDIISPVTVEFIEDLVQYFGGSGGVTVGTPHATVYDIGRGALVLLTLICLWWWYAIFLGRTAPTHGFSMYLLDFITITVFAAGAALWYSANAFTVALMLSSGLMGLRLWLARRVIPSERDKSAVMTVLVLLVISCIAGCVLFLGAMMASSGKTIDVLARLMPVYGYVILVAGITATIAGVIRTEGLPLPKAQVWAEQSRLEFIPSAKRPTGVTDEQMAVLRVCATVPRYEFQDMLMSHDSLPWRKVHLSRVHSEGDTDVQSQLVSLTSVGHDSEIRNKGLMTYFCHWLDDACDTSLIPTWVVDSFIEHGRWPEVSIWRRPISSRFIAFVKDMQDAFAKRGLSSENFDSGVLRILMGAKVFSGSEAALRARRAHRSHLSRRLGSNTFQSLWDTFKSRFDTRHQQQADEFLHLTAKTAHELWMGLEQWNPSPLVMFHYDLLYAPAICYHNYESERYWKEVASDYTLDEDAAIKTIRAIGSMLVTHLQAKPDDDVRLELRVWQIRSMVLSFSAVLPSQVQGAYCSVADDLETLLPTTIRVNFTKNPQGRQGKRRSSRK